MLYSNYMVCLRMRLLMSQNLSRNLYKANNMGPSVSFPKNIGRLENNVYICTQKGSYGTSIYDSRRDILTTASSNPCYNNFFHLVCKVTKSRVQNKRF